ncbi:hypothetical protein [Ottowia thiooxydans]|uniref:hypothetical protein n=1 Tax=Ottowia thiooxydans TaxID=219182 RepID=UPI0012EC28C3|nr:hypothetical protein [Ottowia thiooxydans]
MKCRMVLLSAALVLAACGGGGDGGSAEPVAPTPTTPTTPGGLPPPEPATPVAPAGTTAAEILALADATNLAGTSYPWNGRFAGMVKRWRLPIPVKTNGEARAVPAMDAIEAKLGFTVFDRTSLANADETTITRGLVFRQGTSYLPVGGNPRSFCANVSDAPLSGGWSASMVSPGELTGRIYVNLDNPQCVADAEIVIHEIGHAMGLATHFKGFGGEDDDGAIGPEFWPVLATLYANPIGTPKASVVVKQIKD